MVKHVLLALAALALGGLVASGLTAGGSGSKSADPDEAEFRGKIVFVQTAKEAATLEQVRVKRLGDRLFLVGRIIDDEVLTNRQFAGGTLWLPVAEVARMVAFDNLNQLKNSVGARQGK
jgi:hypothetical protein